MNMPGKTVGREFEQPPGRWPTNVALDNHAAAELDRQSGTSRSRVGKPRGAGSGDGWGMTATGTEYDDEGGASRFFPVFKYTAKAGTAERPEVDGVRHPTVKPVELVRWLVRLVTPPGGVVLDPFAGSGTTAEACILEGFRCVTIEREASYLPLIRARLGKPMQPGLFGSAS
jgi:site-specific DNA-methyltransferase (adenine-specific)